MRTSKKVVVVGGGIGGLTAALSLRRHGHEVVVLERRATSEEAGAGISLWPNAMRILRDLGLGPALEASAISDGRATIRTRRGRHLATSDMAIIERRFAAPLSVVHRRHLLDVLRTAVGDDTLRLGSTCTGATQDEHVASALVADGGQVEGDVIVAADGVGSRLREALLGPPPHAPAASWRGEPSFPRTASTSPPSPARPGRWPAVRSCAPDAEPALLVRLRPRSRVVGALGGSRARDAARALRRLARSHPGDHRLHRAGDDHPHTAARHPPLATWVSGRVALLGDAAHAMLPNLGQGGCQAIEDAAALATSLATGGDGPTPLPHTNAHANRAPRRSPGSRGR